MAALEFYLTDRASAAVLIQFALAEDLRDVGDLTSQAIIPAELEAEINVVSRQPGRLAGGPIAAMLFSQLDPEVEWTQHIDDGESLEPGSVLATVSGPVRSLLTGERTALNFLTQLSGTATATAKYVEAVAGTKAIILDTRKTWPGWRALQKYAVRAGGGTNHRMGLYDGVMIKDNHVAACLGKGSLADAIRLARAKVDRSIPIEVEVDTLQQLRVAIPAEPEIVLLDNMNVAELREAVALRDELAPRILLEASGGITLRNVGEVAQTGVDRISIGALTHSVIGLDIGFDWSGLEQG